MWDTQYKRHPETSECLKDKYHTRRNDCAGVTGKAINIRESLWVLSIWRSGEVSDERLRPLMRKTSEQASLSQGKRNASVLEPRDFSRREQSDMWGGYPKDQFVCGLQSKGTILLRLASSSKEVTATET